MPLEDYATRRAKAGSAFDRREGRDDGVQVANSLAYGLTTLRNFLFHRVHDDVEEVFGVDSMLTPFSPTKSEATTKVQIEIFQCVESAHAVRQRSYLRAAEGWYLNWLARLRLGQEAGKRHVSDKLQCYASMEPDARRLAFSEVLEHVFPEARHVPLVLYRLYPAAVGIVTAMAFGDRLAAAELRNAQTTWLPSISDCHECHGRPLDNGDQCAICGNPLWKFDWLTAAD